MPSVSIIIPIYQSAETLQKCLNSIINQTYTDFELLLIDDGSTDGSRKICLDYQLKDKRIKYFYQKNSGVSSARNKGICEAKGEWITFIDSDDYIDSSYLEHFQLYGQTFDFMMSGYKTILSDGTIKVSVPEVELKGEIKQMPHYLLDFEHFFNPPWGKMFLRSLIEQHSLRFNPKYCYGEDKLFVLAYLSNCRSWKILSQSHYYYCIGKGLSTKIYPYSVIWDWNEEVLSLYKKIGENFGMSLQRIQQLSRNTFCYFTLYMVNSLYQLNIPQNERLHLIASIYQRRKGEFSFKDYKTYGKAMMIGSWCYRLSCPRVTDFVYRLAFLINRKGLMR